MQKHTIPVFRMFQAAIVIEKDVIKRERTWKLGQIEIALEGLLDILQVDFCILNCIRHCCYTFAPDCIALEWWRLLF